MELWRLQITTPGADPKHVNYWRDYLTSRGMTCEVSTKNGCLYRTMQRPEWKRYLRLVRLIEGKV